MKTLRWLLVAAVSAILLTRPRVIVASPASAAHLAALHLHRTNLVQGLLSGSAELLSVASSDTVRLITESQPTVIGPANVETFYRAFLNRFSVRGCTRTETGVFDLGRRVVEIGHFTEQLVLKQSGQIFNLNGNYLDAWEKLSDGRLQLVTAAWNYDAAPPDGDLLRFPEVPSVRTAFQPRVTVNSNLSFELAALCRLIETAVTQHDANVWSRCYADDAVLLANNSAGAVGRKAVDNYIAAHCRELPVFEQLDIRNDRIEELDGYVFEYASHVASWRNGDSSGVSTGKNLRIWRREPDHALKIFLQIGAYD